MSVDPTTPVLIGAGTAQQRFDERGAGRDLVGLIAQAILAAGADAGPGALGRVGLVLAMRGMWPQRDPGGAALRALGLAPARSVAVNPGVLQTSVFARAADAVRDGQCDVALVVGGEAKYRDLRATIDGNPLEPADPGPEPDKTWSPHGDILSKREIALRLVQATHHYAMIENARRFADGQPIADHAREVAALWARFNEVARHNPEAWHREPFSAAAIAAAGPKNRPLAFPYNKWHNSQWNVDQAGALLFTRAEVARALEIPDDSWVYPHAIANSEHMVPVSARAHIDRSPGFAAAGKAALRATGLGVDDIAHLDLYSCFPIAVRTQTRELGIRDDRQLTVTGGMTWAGGPLNNYVVQSLAKMAQVLRNDPGAVGMVTAISGMITKQGVSLWSARPPREYRSIDVTAAARERTAVCEVVDATDTSVSVASYTVLHDGERPRGIVVGDLGGGRRALVQIDDPDIIAAMQTDEYCGRRLKI